MPALHSLPTQSDGTRQAWPATHFEQSGPPQSLSLSLPFVTRSPQVGAAQPASPHFPDWQSESMLQPPVTGQVLQEPPPQSASVSLLFWVPSLQPAA